jgi:hypothetical protein
MSDMTLKEETPENEPKIDIRVVPGNSIHLLDIEFKRVAPFLKEMEDASKGDFTTATLYIQLTNGDIYLGMVYKIDAQGKEDLAGFFIYRLDVLSRSIHLWVVYILEKYRNTNVTKLGMEWLEDNFSKMRLESVSVGVVKGNGMDAVLRNFGFSETFTTYRKALSHE